MADTEHDVPTQKRELLYLFTDKHHGGGTSEDACWTIDRAEEFSVFDLADSMDIFDAEGRFYGILPDGNGSLRELGTWQEQVAEFPVASPNTAWHGYPIRWSKHELAPPNRASEKCRPDKVVFLLMEARGLITGGQKRRLMKGDHI